jgi:hypothetical protein
LSESFTVVGEFMHSPWSSVGQGRLTALLADRLNLGVRSKVKYVVLR